MSEEIVLSDRNVPRQPLQEELTRLYSQGFLTDVTISTEDGKNFEAHKVLLAARSSYFHSILPRLKPDPVIFLKGIKGAHLDKILKFIYGTSVSVSKHQLKPILEVAKALQVKGLQDVSPNDVLSRQSVVSAGKFKPDSPLASPLLTKAATAVQQQQHQTRGASSSAVATLVDKTTLTTFKNPSGSSSKRAAAAAAAKAASKMQNGSAAAADSDSDEKDKEESEEDSSAAVGTRTRKGRGRGRPPKRMPGKDTKGKEDPYEFEEESNDGTAERQSENEHGSGGKKGWRYQKKKSGKGTQQQQQQQQEEEEDAEDEEVEEQEDSEAMSSPVPEDDNASRKERGTKYTINGKQVLPVRCKGELAELHLSRFVSGIRGHSISYKDQWMTPQEFEMVCGYNGKKYLENIQTDYGPLKALTASGMLKAQQQQQPSRTLRKREDESPKSSGSPEKRGKRRRRRENENEEEEENQEEEEEAVQNNDEEEETEDVQQQHDKSNEVDAGSQTADNYHVMRGSAKRKKKKHRDDWKRQIASQLKNESAAAAAAAASNMVGMLHQQQQQGGMMEEHPPQIHAERSDGHVVITSSNAFTLTMDQPPKISPSAMMQPPEQQQQQQQTIYVMSPHPSMGTPATPQHNPFASMSPHPHHQMPIHIPVSTSTGITMATMNLKTNSQPHAGLSRIGGILNVRCKSSTALLYSNKYESGSKGKCIQLGDEWLTPNEFEDRAGSKAKKYLSSIKCMGRPLRVYVNSGELRGSGPAPARKGSSKAKKLKMGMSTTSNMQPIAPAPPAMQQAPQTPSHMSNAPQIPTNLSMLMNNQPPILLNQQSMLAGNQHNLIPGMTFTIAQPLEVRQNTQGM